MPDSTTDNEELEKGVINVGGRIIGSYVDLKDPLVPTENDYILIIRVNADGTKRYGKYTVDELIAALGAEVTQAAQEVSESAQAVEQIANEAKEFINANAGKGFRTLIGDGSTKTFTVEHDLGTAQIMVYLWYTGDGTLPFYSVEKNPLTPNQITIDFETAPPIESVEVLISTIRAVERTEDVTPDDMADSTEMSGADVLAILNV